MQLYDKIQETIQFIHSKIETFQPRFGIVLGTGLGGLTSEIRIVFELAYSDLPHFPTSTVEGHAGKLVFGYLEDFPVVAMAGRFHYYEGYSMKEVTFPIRVLKFLGIERLIISNAAGGVNANYQAGDIVFIEDHINMQPENPLRGINDERLGVRFPDMLDAYDKAMNKHALNLAKQANIRAHCGVYLGLQGPNLETPAEYQFMHNLGADVIGMSTVPEVLVAKHMNLPVFVLSVVSNQCYPIQNIKETTIDEVLEVVSTVEPKCTYLIKTLLSFF